MDMTIKKMYICNWNGIIDYCLNVMKINYMV